MIFYVILCVLRIKKKIKIKIKYLIAILKSTISVPMLEIFIVEMCLTLAMIFRMGHGVNMQIERPCMRISSYLSAITMFTIFITVCDIITYELPNAIDSNLWPSRWKSTTLTIWIKIDKRTFFINVHVCVPILLLVVQTVCSR